MVAVNTKTLRKARIPATLAALAAGAAAAYMAYEARWVDYRTADLLVPGLPEPWSGTTVLHLSDVHAGSFALNERNLAKVVDWAGSLSPDLVILTGDTLGELERSRPCLQLLARLEPPLGTFAVTGNHEYGLGKSPLARARDTSSLWQEAGVTLLQDTCVALPPRDGASLLLCGADHLTGGHGLLRSSELSEPAKDSAFPVLLTHAAPSSDSPLAKLFPLAFAGHTHGGQLRVPSGTGLVPLHKEEHQHLSGVHRWGAGLMVVSRGVGVSFLPFRLLTRPEATLWRLVYTSSDEH